MTEGGGGQKYRKRCDITFECPPVDIGLVWRCCAQHLVVKFGSFTSSGSSGGGGGSSSSIQGGSK